jgi:hydrogenase expression/formation protein HypE
MSGKTFKKELMFKWHEKVVKVVDERVQLGQGAGGELMQRLIREVLIPRLRKGEVDSSSSGLPPDLLDDSASVGDVAFTIDGHTIWPLEFPGGDIGSLSVFGTVNDLAVVGAVPKALALSMVIEEGLGRDVLERVASSIGESAQTAGVAIVTGDTKVVEKGGVKGMITSTAGIGWRHPALSRCIALSEPMKYGRPLGAQWLRDDAVRPGDHIILTGSVGDHGISLLSFREGYGFDTDVRSDLASLNGLISNAIEAGGLSSAKDLTRGGLSNALNEWAGKSVCSIEVNEAEIPVKGPVASACDMLGFDPFEIGNEGKAIIAVANGLEEEVLKEIRKDPSGKDAVLIGRAKEGKGRVILETSIGGRRIMDPPYGDPVPRIC